MSAPHPADRDDLSHDELRDVLVKLCTTHPTNFNLAVREAQAAYDMAHPRCSYCGEDGGFTILRWIKSVIPEYWRESTTAPDLSEMMEKVLDAVRALEGGA
jgi:hypothetical protein